MRASFAAALVAAFAAIPAIARADDPVDLKWSLKAGDTFYLHQAITREQTTESGGNKNETNSEISTVIRFKVIEAKGWETVLEMTYLKVQSSTNGGRPKSIDTKNRFAGVSMTVRLDGNQNVTKLEGHAAFLDKLSDGDKVTRKQLEAILSESAVRQIVTIMFVATPDRPVKVGDSWAKNDRVRLGELGEMTTDSKFTLDKLKDGIATV